MRRFLPGLLPLLLAVPMRAQNGATVEGSVVSSVTGAGVAGVTVELTVAGSKESKEAAYRATTDAQGAFRIQDVAPGDYTASYERDGFEPPYDDSGERICRVAGAGNTVRLRAELVPLATLRGQVLDGEDRPVGKVPVEWLDHASGQPRIIAITNDDGRFSITGIRPGTYLLRAAPGSNFELYATAHGRPIDPATLASGLGAERKAFAPTYYPNTKDRVQASRIQVRGGGELQGFLIHLRETSVFRLRGTVLDETGQGVSGALVKLKSADSADPVMNAPPYAQIRAGEDGRFEFPAVGPGNWRLVAVAGDGRRMGFGSLAVTHYDLEDVRLRLCEPFTVRAAAEGLPAGEDRRDRPRQFRLVPADGPVEQEVYSGSIKEGRMLAGHVYPGRYRFTVRGALSGYYLDSILLGDREVLGQEIELTAAPPPVRFIYRSDGGRVHGNVEDGGRAHVVLFPQDPTLWFHNMFLYHTRCEENGQFGIGAIRPGDYYAVALGMFDASAFPSPAIAEALAKVAVRLRVERDAEASLKLRVEPWPE